MHDANHKWGKDLMHRLGLAVAAALLSTLSMSSTSLAQEAAQAQNPQAQDPRQYLEEVEGKPALDWVKAQNTRSLNVLENDARYKGLLDDALKIVNSKDRIPFPGFRSGSVDNFWQDADHVRGIWRRTSLNSYLTANPVWDTVLDIDALSKAEKANWVNKGASCLAPDERYCLVNLSNGGKDAVEVREFDAKTKAFVEGGFKLPEGKQSVSWVDKDHLLIGREWTPGEVTASGYAYVIKRLKRGQSLDQAETVYAGQKSDMGVYPVVVRDNAGKIIAEMILRKPEFFTSEYHILTGKGTVKVPMPPRADLHGYYKGQLIFTLEEAYAGLPQGAVVALDFQKALADPANTKPTLIFAPNARQSINGITQTKNHLVIDVMTNVTGAVDIYDLKAGKWSKKSLNLPKNATISLGATREEDDKLFVTVTSFLQPTSLMLADAATGKVTLVKQLPPKFDAKDMVAEQFEATSKDGTKVPYFVVHKKGIKLDGTNPTLLYAYGGFQVSMQPSYSGNTGKLWLERGGVYVLANIRGGGEFGPAWHQAGLKTKRQAIYNDFQAVAEDLIAKKITSPRRLGIQGGSNGGLLMGVQLTQRPDLWNAVIVQVPLLDMMRYHKLLAGASWMGEYGNPEDPVEGAFLKGISPYHNLKDGVKYPEPFFVTSTKDDRVHPGHARKMAAKMESMGLPFFYYENVDGGHSAAANQLEAAHRVALEMTYLTRKLMD